MDFSALIKKSFEIAWHNRVLWFFGFLSGGMSGVSMANPGFNWNLPSGDFPRSPESFPKPGENVLGHTTRNWESFFTSIPPETLITIFLVAALVILVVLLILIFVSNWAAAGLVFSILNRGNERPNFRSAARAGLKYWVKFYLVTLILGLFVISLLLILGAPLLLFLVEDLRSLAFAYLAVGLILFIILIFLVAIVGSLIVNISQRLIIHKGTGVIESIKVSAALLRKYKGEAVLTWLVAMGLNFGASFAIFIVLLPVILILFVIFFINIYAALVALVPALAILFVAAGFWNAYQAVYWTLFYEHLASREGW